MEAPNISQEAGSHTEGDHVGQRIQFLAEFARRIRHAGDAPVKGIERNGKKNCERRPVQAGLRVTITADRREGLHNGEVARADVSHREQRGEQVHAAMEPRLPLCPCRRIVVVHRKSPSSSGATLAAAARLCSRETPATAPAPITAIILLPPLTRWPTLTRSSTSPGMITSVREPNFIIPTRWPRSTRSPTLNGKTMRRASRPAICLNTISMPSPRMVTILRSL